MRGYQARRGGVAEIVKRMSGKPAAVRADVKLRFTLLVKPNTSPSLIFGDDSQSVSNSRGKAYGQRHLPLLHGLRIESANGQHAIFEINVAPFERQNLATTHARIKRADYDWP